MAFLKPNEPFSANTPKLVVEGDAATNKPLGPGTYKFQLVVVDKDGISSDPTVVNVRVLAKPIARFVATRQPIANQPFELDASTSVDPDGSIDTYLWTLLS